MEPATESDFADFDLRSNDWECHKHIIRDLYVEQNLPLAKVQKQMLEQFRFEGTYVTDIINIITTD